MSLNRTEQAIFDYWERSPDEQRHWHAKVVALTRAPAAPGPELARALERELWEYLVERTPHVPALRQHHPGGGRLSLLNLAEHVIRLWGPPPKPRPARPPQP